MLTEQDIANVTRAPLGNVEGSWPLIVAALQEQGIYTKNVAVCAAATTAVETGITVKKDGHPVVMTFLPVKEGGGDAYLNHLYDQRTDMGFTPALDGDGALWCGRGFVQLTGPDNYGLAEDDLGIPLRSDPSLALKPENAARLLAWYLKRWRVAEAAEAGQWERARRRVNGGTNGLAPFLSMVQRLLPLWRPE